MKKIKKYSDLDNVSAVRRLIIATKHGVVGVNSSDTERPLRTNRTGATKQSVRFGHRASADESTVWWAIEEKSGHRTSNTVVIVKKEKKMEYRDAIEEWKENIDIHIKEAIEKDKIRTERLMAKPMLEKIKLEDVHPYADIKDEDTIMSIKNDGSYDPSPLELGVQFGWTCQEVNDLLEEMDFHGMAWDTDEDFVSSYGETI